MIPPAKHPRNSGRPDLSATGDAGTVGLMLADISDGTAVDPYRTERKSA